MSQSPSERWILRPRPNPRARLRLLCLPHAGGGASAFRGWADALPVQVEVCPVQLPGRETRIAEPAIDRMGPLAEALADALARWRDLPFAVFGHSNGALIGFELARRLRRTGAPGPVHLFACGRRAPDAARPGPPTAHLPDAAFLDSLRDLGGIPDALREHPELLALLLPTLRADVALNEAYVFTEEAPLACPITGYAGELDPRAPPAEMERWARHTSAAFALRTFPGGHFFPQTHRAEVLRALSADLPALLGGPS
ncbi:MAG TPA: thioesterase domain-containing protein [Longimicrobium sp.]|nr:thioesterase domain-containing protein [Longimicrobium sp.]